MGLDSAGSTVQDASSKRWLSITWMLAAACSYGVVSTILKLAYHHGLHTRMLTASQYDIACVLLWAIAGLWPKGGRIRKRQWVLLAAIGVCGAGTSFSYYFALTVLPASLGIVLLFQFTWMVPLMDLMVHRRWPTPARWLGLAFIVAGTFLAVGLGGSGGLRQVPLWGILCGVLSGLCYGLQLFLSGYLDEDSSPALRSALLITFAAIFADCVAPPTWLFDLRIWHSLWLWALLAALFAQVIPMLLMSIAIPRIGGRMAGVLGAVELPAAVILAWLLLHERVAAEQWFGTLLILGGMSISELWVMTRWGGPRP